MYHIWKPTSQRKHHWLSIMIAVAVNMLNSCLRLTVTLFLFLTEIVLVFNGGLLLLLFGLLFVCCNICHTCFGDWMQSTNGIPPGLHSTTRIKNKVWLVSSFRYIPYLLLLPLSICFRIKKLQFFSSNHRFYFFIFINVLLLFFY